MAKLNNFEKGVIDFLRQRFVGNEHYLMSSLEGFWPDEDDDPEGAEAFRAGFEFAREMAEQDPSAELQRRIKDAIPWDA